MDATSVLLVVAAVGVNFGWQPDQRDPQAYEFVVQLEPQLLDALRAGDAVPIDAHIPPGVTPIRKVRVLVGTRDLPRKQLAATTASRPRIAAYPPRDDANATANPASASQPSVVRGQDPGWSDDRYQNTGTANSRRYEQLGPTIGVDPIRTAQAPPPLNRAQNAVVETGNTLRSGVEAGIQQANQQLGRAGSGLLDGANSVGRGVSEQLQNVTGTRSGSSSSVWAPPPLWEDATGSSASPPATTASTAPANSSAAWTSIRPDLAPPRLPIPTLRSTDVRVAGNGSAAWDSGPSFPSALDNRAPLHSVLIDPASSNSPSATVRNSSTASDWSDSWGTAPASSAPIIDQSSGNTTANDNARWAWPAPNSGTSSSFASSTPTATNSPAVNMPSAASDDRYSQPANTPPSNSILWPDWDRQSATLANDPTANNNAALPPTRPSQTPAAPTAEPQSNQPTIGFAPPATTNPQPATSQQELPWLPLLGASVGLVGSLAANLFLGMSYADARQKYRALVRKTTHDFQKFAGVAA